MEEQALRSHVKSKKHLNCMEPVNVFFQPCRQPVITTTTEQSTAEPSEPSLVLNSSSAEKRKAELQIVR